MSLSSRPSSPRRDALPAAVVGFVRGFRSESARPRTWVGPTCFAHKRNKRKPASALLRYRRHFWGTGEHVQSGQHHFPLEFKINANDVQGIGKEEAPLPACSVSLVVIKRNKKFVT
jgi:hypothetical protein